MSKRILDMPEKLGMVDADEFHIIDSEDADLTTKDKRVKKTNVQVDPTAHASTHYTGGSDEIIPAAIGAEPAIGAKNTAFNTNWGIVSGTTAQGNDSRFSNARVPLPHADTHEAGHSDEITPESINAEPAGTADAKVSTHDGSPAAHGANIPTTAQKAALDAANAPSGGNAYATIADVGTGGDDEKVGVSATDTTPDYLQPKLVSGDASVSITRTNQGGDEKLDLRATGAGGGEANTGENVGAGTGLYVGMNGTMLQFRSNMNSPTIEWSQTADTVSAVVPAGTFDADGEADAAVATHNADGTAHSNVLPTSDEKAAMTAASAPTALNAFATQADVDGAGTGDVVGPISSSDNAVCTFDGTSGKLIQSLQPAFVFTPGGSYDILALDTKGSNHCALAIADTNGGAALLLGGTGVGDHPFRVKCDQTGGIVNSGTYLYKEGLSAGTISNFVSGCSSTNIIDFSAGTGADSGATNKITFSVQGNLSLDVRHNVATYTVPVVLPGDPTSALQAATKQYVDASGGGWVDESPVLSWKDTPTDLGSSGANVTHALTAGHYPILTITAGVDINFTFTLAGGEARNWAMLLTSGGFAPIWKANGLTFDTSSSPGIGDWYDITTNGVYLASFTATSAGARITGLQLLGSVAA